MLVGGFMPVIVSVFMLVFVGGSFHLFLKDM
jgi:hypothetical protein